MEGFLAGSMRDFQQKAAEVDSKLSLFVKIYRYVRYAGSLIIHPVFSRNSSPG